MMADQEKDDMLSSTGNGMESSANPAANGSLKNNALHSSSAYPADDAVVATSPPQTPASSHKSSALVRSGQSLVQSQSPASRLSAARDRPSTARLPAPSIVVHHDSPPSKQSLQLSPPKSQRIRPSTARASNEPASFLPITTAIPTGSLEDLISPDRMTFSNRGSIIMLDGNKWGLGGTPGSGRSSPRKKAVSGTWNTTIGSGSSTADTAEVVTARQRLSSPSSRSTRVLSSDEASLSLRVRSMYEQGTEDPISDQTLVEEEEEEEDIIPEEHVDTNGTLSPTTDASMLRRSLSRNSSRANIQIQKKPHETAGGIEDWEDVHGGEVDRYGFITPRPVDSRSSNKSGLVGDAGRLHRVSTSLLEASNTPRKRGVLRRMPSRNSAKARNSMGDGKLVRQPSKRSVNGQGSIYSHKSNKSVSNSQISLRSPLSSKDRKAIVDAGDMLTLPPGLSAEQDEKPITKAMRQKEWEREVKWKKMGRLRSTTKDGSGMQFDFDPKDPKVISRTWKGIPDRWRAMAWYSFLEASARRHKDSPAEALLIEEFHELQSENSADDVQIDCDVPRTINRHIMFRRRYRGGQRLLFRVLHALSLYFPEIGYVQGMAALAATLLCYYDEEHAFIMMVRLWQHRGLHRLYESGFEGLMDALSEFEKHWLGSSPVAKKLDELTIPPTSYGTRWYLTLFNYSIPFPAQLRVWDVFMLLGDEANTCAPAPGDKPDGFNADLDILHATSAALIDGTREILLESDFENAMKVLTSWIPIKDEELLIKVAHVEWKQRKRRGAKRAP